MAGLNTKGLSHTLLSTFVDWIRPEESTVEKIRKQAEEIRSRISGQAAADDLVVQATPWSGSYAKNTGLRRHLRGNHDVEGQDIDLPFVVSPRTTEGEKIDALLGRFHKYAQASYPNTSLRRTKSSIQLDFAGTKLRYDLVPMLAIPGNNEKQILLRADGERRETSVQKHIEFIKTRTNKSNQPPGRVKFNEMVRLVKWWREMRQSESQVFNDVPSIVIELLCADAFDALGVEETYTETLHKWFGRMAHRVEKKERIQFKDFSDPSRVPCHDLWVVFDPVNPQNNVVPPAWREQHLSLLTTWLTTGRDSLHRATQYELNGQSASAKDLLVKLFGSALG